MVVEKGWVRPAAQVGVCVCTMARRGRGSGGKKEKKQRGKREGRLSRVVFKNE